MLTMQFQLHFQFLILCCTITRNFVQSLDDINKNVIVSLAQGQQLKGLNTTSDSGVTVYKFYGIRYALPPTGHRRFKAPEPDPGWSGVKDAVSKSAVCPQNPVEKKPSAIPEDCLFLNVFTPDLNSSLPVLVWIHGGGLSFGSAYSDGDGATLAPKGIVAVTINYRLGALGFMSTGDDVMPGNYGMLDQVLALKWVQKYIGAFGGDPNRVTIGGESAGARSVSMLVVSPLANGLFRRAIMESGSCLSPTAMERPGSEHKVKESTLRSASKVGCNQATSSEILQCLQNVTVADLFNATHDFVIAPRIETSFGFLPHDPINLYKSGNYNKVDTLHGTNSGEFSVYVQDPENDGLTRKETIPTIKTALGSFINEDEIVRLISEACIGNETDPFILRSKLVTTIADVLYGGGTILEFSLVSNPNTGTKHFLYEFDYRASDTTTPAWKGVAHAAERRYVFYPDNRYNYTTSEDKAIGEDVQTMWTNFIKFGNPTPSNTSHTSANGNRLVKWNNFTPASPNLLKIDVNSTLVPYPRLFLIPLFDKILQILQSNVPITVVGHRRFKAPEPDPGWSGVKDAVNKSAVCPQSPVEENPSAISEDCLFLNVFTPDLNSSLPVLVWIHGGGLLIGSAYSDGDGATLAPKEIVAVTINYRLGALGFMSTGDDVMPGNYGMLDQVLALKWVQKYIGAFGGDPNRVTIGGESAGARSVSLLVVSPLANGLFKKAIMESGSCLSPTAMERPGSEHKVKESTLRSASKVGCNQATSSEILQCLQNVTVADLFNATQDFVNAPRIETSFGFLPHDPINLYKSGNYNKVDTLHGTNSGEFSFFVQDPENDGVTRQQIISTIKAVLGSLINGDEIVRLISEACIGNETDPFILRSKLVTTVADVLYGGGTILEFSLVSNPNTGTKHFLYEFDYRVSDTTTPAWKGVEHGAERRFVFYPDIRHNYKTSEDKAIGEDVQTMWTNFIKFGNPTPSNISHTSANGNHLVKWNNFTPASPNLFKIDVNSTLVSYPRLFLIPLFDKILEILQSDVPITVVGQRRFKAPEPDPGWSGVKDAVSKSAVCPQSPVEEKPSAILEDCLFLNVFTPDLNSSLPVLVWIHGGGLRIGSAYSDGDGATLAPKGVVAVTINYRLGALGFMSTGDDVMPGNYGFLDQVLALKWVQKYIGAFGGDPNQVTIGGESAGARSVSLLVVSPLANGLFKRAIMESGSCLAPSAIERPGSENKVKESTLRSASQVGCNQATSSEILQCLQNVDFAQLFNATQLAVTSPRIETGFGFLPDDPINLYKRGNYNKVDTLHGTNSGEFSFFVQDPENDGVTRQQIIPTIKAALGSLINIEKISQLISEACIGNETDPFTLRSNLVTTVADVTFGGGTILEFNLISNPNTGTKHFLYEFDYRVSDNTTPAWQGVAHAAERRFVFYPDTRYNYKTSEDKTVGEDVQTMWTNFIKFGNPTPSNTSHTSVNGNHLVKWNNFTPASPNLLKIDVNSTLVSYPRLFLIPLFDKILEILQSDVPITIVG